LASLAGSGGIDGGMREPVSAATKAVIKRSLMHGRPHDYP